MRDLESGSDEENDLRPVVVVLDKGDLTAEEADRVAKEKEEGEFFYQNATGVNLFVSKARPTQKRI